MIHRHTGVTRCQYLLCQVAHPTAGLAPMGTPAAQGSEEFVSLPSNASSTSNDSPRRHCTLANIYDNMSIVELDYNGLCPMATEEPGNFIEAEEIKSIEENETWYITNLPNEHQPIGLKWVYKVKKNSLGAMMKHKAQLAAKGYVQR